MTNEEINKAIAEHVGTADRWLIVKRGYFYRPEAKGYTSSESGAWKLPIVEAKRYEYLIGDEPVTLSRASIPNYAGDLNAIHEAEKALDDHEHDRMRNQLWLLMIKTTERNKTSRRVHSAEARERAEALLRTIGKWKENE